MLKVTTALIFLGMAIFLFGWNDPFHLGVGIPILLAGIALARAWKRRMRVEEEDEQDEQEEDGVAHQVFIGAIAGFLFIALLAGVFSAAARTPLYALFYDRDCSDLLQEVSILEQGKAYQRIVEIIDHRQKRQISPDCDGKLAGRKIRGLLAWAEESAGEQRVSRLEWAREEAKRIGNSDLLQLVTVKLQAEERERLIEEQGREIDKNRELINKLKETDLVTHETNRGVIVNLPDILFDPGKAELTDPARDKVNMVAGVLNSGHFQPRKAIVEGHTDSSGSERANQKLSESRAQAVAGALIENGVEKNRLEVRGLGEAHPIAANETLAGRAKNRRVEIVIQN